MLSVLKNYGICIIPFHVILMTHYDIKDAVSEKKAAQHGEVHYLTSSGTEVGTWAIQL